MKISISMSKTEAKRAVNSGLLEDLVRLAKERTKAKLVVINIKKFDSPGVV